MQEDLIDGARANLSCIYLTSGCADPETPVGRGIMRKLGFPKEATPEDVEKFNKLRKNLPDIPEGSLGTCAIVANSDNLLKAQRWGLYKLNAVYPSYIL